MDIFNRMFKNNAQDPNESGRVDFTGYREVDEIDLELDAVDEIDIAFAALCASEAVQRHAVDGQGMILTEDFEEQCPIDYTLHFDSTDPRAVRLHLQEVDWLFGRELLSNAMAVIAYGGIDPVGVGDVVLYPIRETKEFFMLLLRAPEGHMWISLRTADAVTYLKETESLNLEAEKNLQARIERELAELLGN